MTMWSFGQFDKLQAAKGQAKAATELLGSLKDRALLKAEALAKPSTQEGSSRPALALAAGSCQSYGICINKWCRIQDTETQRQLVCLLKEGESEELRRLQRWVALQSLEEVFWLWRVMGQHAAFALPR